MDLDEEILSDFSDSEIVESKHKSLVDTISSLDKKARLKPASRKEPSLQISEYHLVNKGDNEKEQKKLVDIKSLVKSLKKKPSNNHIAKKIAAVHDPSKNLTLPKPLEKIHSDKIEREVAYENVKEDISKWDPIVFDNRTADQIKFPLKQIDVDAVEDELKKEKSHHNFLNTFKKPTQLEVALANLLDSSKVVAQYREEKERREQELRDRREENRNAEFKLTLQEMKEKQKEFTKLRAQKAFKEKKAWMQNKIKSKKYHRMMKREKVKEKLKEFEKLQKTDPEAALAQLELLDKTRAEERITLRHKSTGQWAKNLQVRAKYDRESRVALAEQLSQSRALSVKVKRADSSDEEPEEAEDSGVEQDGEEEEGNPWMSKGEGEVGSYFSGYRKYWREKEEEKSKEKEEEKEEEEEEPGQSTQYGAVSLEKLAGTFDDMDEDMDMPVFLEAATNNSVTCRGEDRNETELKGSETSKEKSTGKKRNRKQKREEKIEEELKSNETTEEEINETFEEESNETFEEVTASKGKKRKRKSREAKIENILDRSGQWTVIPVENDEENIVEEQENNFSRKKKKCDSNAVTSNVNKPLASPKDTKNKKNTTKKGSNNKNNTPSKLICDTSETLNKNSKKKKQQKIDLSTELAIDEAFDSLESSWKDQVKEQVNVIASAISKQAKADQEKGKKKAREERFDFNDRKASRKVIEIDESMNETRGESGAAEQGLKKITELGKQALSLIPSAPKPANGPPSSEPPLEQIDPAQFLKVDKTSSRMLSRVVPETLQEGALDDEEGEGEEEEGEGEEKSQQLLSIEEAFADDDVVQEFRQEKESDSKKSKFDDIDLSLPGWGCWGGPDITKKKTKRKRRRFVIKGVKVPRKDDEKPIVIINEDANEALKNHLVSVVPHPFTSVADYEASLRAPMGREWVPEIAHRKLTQPTVRTRLGALIEPIDFESEVRSKLKEYR